MALLQRVMKFFTASEARVQQPPSSGTNEYREQVELRSWLEEALNEVSNTPDAMVLDQYDYQLVFVCGEMMKGLPKHHFLGDDVIYYARGFTKQTSFTMWKKKLGKEALIIPLRSLADPKSSSIRGELYLVPTALMYKLDKYYHNKIFFKRKKVKINVPHSERIRRPNSNGDIITTMSEVKNLEVQAWLYVGDNEHWDSILDGGYMFGMTERFFPKNPTPALSSPYFSATIKDFTSSFNNSQEEEIIEQRRNNPPASAVPRVPLK